MRKLWSLWKRFGQAMGDFIARLVLTLFYFTIFAPFGLGVRLWGDYMYQAKSLSGMGLS